MGLVSTVGGILLTFGRECSISGINNAARAKSAIRAVYWLAIFTIFMVLTVRQLISVITDFYNYPVVTNIDLDHKSSVMFPAISICNLNRYCHQSFKATYM